VNIEINSTWMLTNIDGFEDGIYRVLSILDDISTLTLFRLEESRKILRPSLLTISTFQSSIKLKQIKPCEYKCSCHLLVDEAQIPLNRIELRSKRYRQIKALVKDSNFLFEVASSKNVKSVSKQAKKHGTDNKAIYRLLNLYWKNGQTENALLPAFTYSGAKGKVRENVKKSLGTHRPSRTGSFESPKAYIVREEDRIKFKKSLKKYHLKPDGLNLNETYKNLLRTHYKYEILDASYLDLVPGVPSYRQFVNWSKKIFNKDEFTRLRTTETDYLRNKRGVEAAITDKAPVPGSCFEIDATVADVHIVSEFRRNHVIGRPTIYSIIDRASRMIVGFHVSLYHASWDAARQAIVNAFLPKVEYCQKFGVKIKKSDWPCAHIPQRLICDNGEMIGLKSQKLVVPLTELQFAPTYRPDCKAIVENRFDYINKKSIHRLLGSSRGGKIVRGHPDPRKRAIHTLKEVTQILLKDVLEHNREKFKDLALSSRLLIENDLTPSPINFWNIHLSKHKHALKTATEDEINARLLPQAEVSMTRNGVLFNEMYYSCPRIQELNLASIARTHGRFKLEARVNQDDSSFIFVRLKDNEGFIRCEILDRSKELKDMALAEVYYLLDWIDNKERKSPITTSSIETLEDKENIQKKAIKLSKEAPKLKTKAERTQNTRERRAKELEIMESIEKVGSNPKQAQNSNPRKYSNKVTKLPRRPK